MGQIIRHFANQGRRREIYFYRDHHGREVDFLVTCDRKPWFAVEAKLAETEAPRVRLEPDFGVELLIDPSTKVVQFYALTSTIKGCGRKMVEAVIQATPKDWQVAVVLDWSGGFWPKMAQEQPRLVVF